MVLLSNSEFYFSFKQLNHLFVIDNVKLLNFYTSSHFRRVYFISQSDCCEKMIVWKNINQIPVECGSRSIKHPIKENMHITCNKTHLTTIKWLLFYFWSLEHDQCVPPTNLNAATVFALIWNIAAMADSSAATWVTNVTAQVRRHLLWPTLSSYTRAPYTPEFLLSKIIGYRANVCYLDNIVSVLWLNKERDSFLI